VQRPDGVASGKGDIGLLRSLQDPIHPPDDRVDAGVHGVDALEDRGHDVDR